MTQIMQQPPPEITTSHDITSVQPPVPSGFRSPINNISDRLHSLWTSRCLRDRNTLIPQPRLLRAEREAGHWPWAASHHGETWGAESPGDVFTKVDLSLIDLVPIAARDGAERWHDNYQHQAHYSCSSSEASPARQESAESSVQTVFIKNSEIWVEVSRDRWHCPEWIMSKQFVLRKSPTIRDMNNHDHILNPHFCCVDSVLYLGTRSLAAFWFKRGTRTEILIEELCAPSLVTHSTPPGTDSSKLDTALVFVIGMSLTKIDFQAEITVLD